MLEMHEGVLVGERYELVRLAGSGGMGSVFEALDRETGEKVAVKIMKGASAEERERFDREARVLAGLSHPAIVRYLGHGELKTGEPYLVMEWLSGEPLDTRIARERLGVDETFTLAEGIARALSAAHALGVIHRDIKPSNIFLPDRDVRKATLLDFGIARQAGESRVVTRTGVIMGTPGYVAPEQARGDRALSPRADVFALGCVLFECLAGKAAFTGQHAVAILAKVLFEDVPMASSLRPGVPASLDALIAKMLAKQPEERLADGAAVVAAI
jgi:eukaryotic-like serine/threonine-protein kinase